MRIDVSGDDFPTDDFKNYKIPPNNPFIENDAARDEIWALGLRNPWRFSFDRNTGEMFIADVGQSSQEEINHLSSTGQSGINFGWRIKEGSLNFSVPSGGVPEGLTDPVFEYSHNIGNNCSITGGYVYRGTLYPRMFGLYFYGDYCSGRIWALKNLHGNWVSKELLDTSMFLSTFGEDEMGNLYVSDYTNGIIYHIADSDNKTHLTTSDILQTENSFKFNFETIPGKMFDVEFSNNINGSWSKIGDTMISNGTKQTFEDTSADINNNASRFYRIRVFDNDE